MTTEQHMRHGIAPVHTIGELVADTLRAAGVRHAFTVPGESFLGVLEALGDAGIHVVAARHEGGAGFMAESYGQLTGQPAALLVTRAVGVANAAIAIHTAYADSTPMIVLAGQVPTSSSGREAFQEADLVRTFGALGKWAAEPRHPDEVGPAIRTAVHEACRGRPGPTLVALPEDLLDRAAPAHSAPRPARRPAATDPEQADVAAALSMLTGARRPVIVAGAGVLRAGATEELATFAEELAVPVISSWRRGDVMDNAHPLYLGMTGYWAAATVRQRLLAADALLVLGCRLNEPTTFGYQYPRPDQRWIHVDLEPGVERPAQTKPEAAVRADAGAFLRAANARLRQHPTRSAATRRAANSADRRAWLHAATVDDGQWSGPGPHPGRVIATLRRVLPDDAILTTDAGNFAGWAARGFHFRQPGTFLGPTSGAMGYALPAAVAAAVARPGRPVVALAGDGGLGMTLTELETAVRERVPIVVLCFDNRRYGTIRMWQDRRGRGQGVATDLGAVDFAAAARALGAAGTTVDSDDAFEPALRAALAADRPTLLHIALDRSWVSVDDHPAGHPADHPAGSSR
jgi:acetolactate synthase-1/2/3 large subunit